MYDKYKIEIKYKDYNLKVYFWYIIYLFIYLFI